MKSILVLWTLIPVYLEACEEGWFGLSCRFKCRCLKCNELGNCVGKDKRCQTGWFGPKCQYRNMLHILETPNVPLWIADENDSTCNPNPKDNQLVIKLWATYEFTWMRLIFNNTNDLHSLQVTIKNGTTSMCNVMKRGIVDNFTVDFSCPSNDEFTQISLSGSSVARLCSFFVSIGRNVALRQWTSLTSAENRSDSSMAVDGENSDSESTCAVSLSVVSCRTTLEKCPMWTLLFTRPYIIRYYVLTLKVDSAGNVHLLTFEDNGAEDVTQFLWIKTVNFKLYTKQTIPITKVKVSSFSTIARLGICEIEMYGEAVCPKGLYGLDCEETCRCEDTSDECLSPTGVCPEVCKSGFYGNNCDLPCKVSNCSLCDRNTGMCIVCPVGYIGDFCDKECVKGFYGLKCGQLCSEKCLLRWCNVTNGDCYYCAAGYYKSHCQTPDCKNGTFYCDNRCSPLCLNRSCNPLTGDCMQCPDGHFGPNCQPANIIEDIFVKVSTIIFITAMALLCICCFMKVAKRRHAARMETKRTASPNPEEWLRRVAPTFQEDPKPRKQEKTRRDSSKSTDTTDSRPRKKKTKSRSPSGKSTEGTHSKPRKKKKKSRPRSSKSNDGTDSEPGNRKKSRPLSGKSSIDSIEWEPGKINKSRPLSVEKAKSMKRLMSGKSTEPDDSDHSDDNHKKGSAV